MSENRRQIERHGTEAKEVRMEEHKQLKCIEVKYDQGYIEIPNESDPARIEDWDVVQEHTTLVRYERELIGWGKWTDLYSAVDEFGVRRYFAVEEK